MSKTNITYLKPVITFKVTFSFIIQLGTRCQNVQNMKVKGNEYF